MATNFLQTGGVLDWTNGTGSDVSSGDVVAVGANGNAVLGVALTDIADTASGSVQICGVFECPKVSAAVITAGETLVWDSSAGEFDDNQATPASGDVSGAACWAFADAAASTTTVQVMFTGIPGTLA